MPPQVNVLELQHQQQEGNHQQQQHQPQNEVERRVNELSSAVRYLRLQVSDLQNEMQRQAERHERERSQWEARMQRLESQQQTSYQTASFGPNSQLSCSDGSAAKQDQASDNRLGSQCDKFSDERKMLKSIRRRRPGNAAQSVCAGSNTETSEAGHAIKNDIGATKEPIIPTVNVKSTQTLSNFQTATLGYSMWKRDFQASIEKQNSSELEKQGKLSVEKAMELKDATMNCQTRVQSLKINATTPGEKQNRVGEIPMDSRQAQDYVDAKAQFYHDCTDKTIGSKNPWGQYVHNQQETDCQETSSSKASETWYDLD